MSESLTAWPPGAHAAARCYARPFACQPEDLDNALDISADDIAAAITGLLVGCLRDGDGREVNATAASQWSVPRRRQGLIAIAHATLGDHVQAIAKCTAAACRNPIELELGLVSFVADAPERVGFEVAGIRRECRMPSGADLVAWRREAFDASWLAARLVIADDGESMEWTPARLDALAAALEAADPLAALTVPVTCPSCDAAIDVTLDLEPLLLGALRAVARETLEDVHRLAQAYHWSESEIVTMARGRRRAYLYRLQREGA